MNDLQNETNNNPRPDSTQGVKQSGTVKTAAPNGKKPLGKKPPAKKPAKAKVGRGRMKKSTKAILIVVICVVVVLAAALWYPIQMWNSDAIVAGVEFRGKSLEGMSKSDITKMIQDVQNTFDEASIELYAPDSETNAVIMLKDFDVHYNANDIFNKAYQYGRMGGDDNQNALEAIIQLYKGRIQSVAVDAEISYDSDKLDTLLLDVVGDMELISNEPTYSIEGTNLIITPGKESFSLDFDATSEAVMKSIADFTFEKVECVMTTQEAAPIDIDKIYSEVVCEPQDAAIVTGANGISTIKQEVMGVDFDLEAARAMINDPYAAYSIPVTLTAPKVTSDTLDTGETGIFKDQLVAFSTTLSNIANRTHNVKLAASKINGKVLNPGDEFSFNNTVGPRTEATGFKEAKIYTANEIVDGIGGGICQVSSTLYVAALNVYDLDITSRRSHRFSVSYVKPAFDATVAWGSIDFKFKNNRDTPVKIFAEVNGLTLTVKIRGILSAGEPDYELYSETYGSTSFSVIERVDKSITPGTQKVSQSGSNGYSATLYRKAKYSDGTVKTEKINNTTYSPVNKIVLINPVEETVTEQVPVTPVEPTVPATPEVPQEPQTPTTPTVPETPQEPQTPTTPTVPETPQEPQTPTTPTVPEAPKETTPITEPEEPEKDITTPPAWLTT